MNTIKVCVPPIKIQGIKTKIVPLIKKYVDINENSIWIEPFLGSGVVGFNLANRKAIFSDINPHIINFYNAIKQGTITSSLVKIFLEKEGKKLQNQDEKFYYFIRDRFNSDHNPLDFLFLNRSCFNGMIRFNKNGEFNVPYGHKPNRFSKAYITKIVNQIINIEYKIQNYDWTFICKDFKSTLSNVSKNSFIYCDPPYIGRHVDYYDSWDESDEYNLCNILNKSGCKYIVSTWHQNKYRKNEYIDTIWKNCTKIFQNHFYFIGANEENRNPMEEALLLNYSLTKKNISNITSTKNHLQLNLLL